MSVTRVQLLISLDHIASLVSRAVAQRFVPDWFGQFVAFFSLLARIVIVFVIIGFNIDAWRDLDFVLFFWEPAIDV